jgi:hypothetical protein
MPKEFVFKVDGQETFRKRLYSGRCQGITKTGQRCKRNCIIGFEYCPIHLQTVEHLKIKDSNLPNAGKGLFVSDNTKGPHEVVFRKNDTIAPYNGEVITQHVLNERYGIHTAPYAVRITNNAVIDSAAKRGVGSLANTYPGHNNSNLKTVRLSHTNPSAKLAATKPIRNNQEIYLSYGQGRYQVNEPGVHFYTKNVTDRRR